MRKRTVWLRLFVLGSVIGIAAAAACSDRSGDARLLSVAEGSGNDSGPRDSVPRDSVPGDSVPGDSVPRDSVPGDSVPGDSVPRDSVPRDSIPRDSIPRDSVPRDSIPRDSVPRDSIPRDSVPRDSVPRDTTPGRVASITVIPDQQQVAAGEAGQVWAALRDAAGRRVYDQNILWDLSDSTILRITQGGSGSPYVLFRALRTGRATLTARYGTLSDTGVVFVSDSAPRDTIPRDTLPGPAASITVYPDTIQAAAGDSGWISATLRDSAGREVRDARGEIQWEVTDSTVVRLTNPGSPDWTHTRIWWAWRAGRALIRARYRTLADEAAVILTP
jgi:hypothetical protein